MALSGKTFQMRSTYGAPAGSSLEDWPISYDDLEPFYSKAEWEIGVSGEMGVNTFEAKETKAVPDAGAAAEYRGQRFVQGGAAVGLASVSDPDGD